MALSIDHLEKVGSTFARLGDERDLDAIRPLYHEDAVFVSPNTPVFAPEFGPTLRGCDEIMRYLRAVLKVVPSGRQQRLRCSLASTWRSGCGALR